MWVQKRKPQNKITEIILIASAIAKLPFLFGRMVMYMFLFSEATALLGYHGRELFTIKHFLPKFLKKKKNKKNWNLFKK